MSHYVFLIYIFLFPHIENRQIYYKNIYYKKFTIKKSFYIFYIERFLGYLISKWILMKKTI